MAAFFFFLLSCREHNASSVSVKSELGVGPKQTMHGFISLKPSTVQEVKEQRRRKQYVRGKSGRLCGHRMTTPLSCLKDETLPLRLTRPIISLSKRRKRTKGMERESVRMMASQRHYCARENDFGTCCFLPTPCHVCRQIDVL